jgi:hypothetical protein
MSLVALPTEILIQHIYRPLHINSLIQLSQVDRRLRTIALSHFMIMLRLDRPYDLPQERFGEFLNATILNLRHFFRPVASLYQAQDLAKLALALGFRPDPFNSIQDINKLTSIQVVALGSLDFLKFFLENQFLNGEEVLEFYRASCILKRVSMSRFLLEKLEKENFSELELLCSTYRLGISSNDSTDPIQLVEMRDEYSLFYLHWIDPVKSSILRGDENDYWIKRSNSPAGLSWAGFAFESLCLKHVHKIKDALKIGGVTTQTGYWKSTVNGKKEAEIDLVIDRADQCINLCEIKFCNAPYQMSQSYEKELQMKKEAFRLATGAQKALFTTLITPYGAVVNSAYLSVVDNQLVVDEFF